MHTKWFWVETYENKLVNLEHVVSAEMRVSEFSETPEGDAIVEATTTLGTTIRLWVGTREACEKYYQGVHKLTVGFHESVREQQIKVMKLERERRPAKRGILKNLLGEG